jgi:hypothetical protein
MKARYNRSTVDGTNKQGYIPYPQDLKSNAAFEELEKINQDKFEFSRDLLEDKVEVPAEFKSEHVFNPDDLNKRNVLESDYKAKIFETNMTGTKYVLLN